MAQEVMLVAWFDGKAEKGHPDAKECTGKPGWLTYADRTPRFVPSLRKETPAA